MLTTLVSTKIIKKFNENKNLTKTYRTILSQSKILNAVLEF